MNSGTVQQTYNLHGITFERVGESNIRIKPQGNTSPEFSLKEWNEVLTGLGFKSYLRDTTDTSGSV